MEFKGTKGIWEYKVIQSKRQTKITVQIPETKYEGKTELVFGYIDREDDCGVASCCKTAEHANAKLTACAPEMLEMLQKCLSAFRRENPIDINELKQLIKKATEL